MLGGASNPRSQSLLPHNTVDINKPVDATPTAAGSGLYSDHNPQHNVDDDEWRLKASDFPRADWPGRVEAGCLNVLGRRRTRVDKYYHQQREILREFNELDVLIERQGLGPGMVGDGAVEDDDDADAEGQAHDNGRRWWWWCGGGGGVEREEALAIRVSNYANMVLFAAKVLVSVKSGSLAIIASTLDSLLDLLSGFILWFTAHTMKRPNPYHYPIGKNRMQPVGILVFASVMATLGLQILIESGRRLVSKAGSLDLAGSKAAWVIGVMVSVTVVKFFLMLLCQAYKNGIVRAYAKDHFFDVVTNSVGLAAAFLAYKFQWWIDPAGAVVLAIYTIWNWSFTVLENVKSLVGETAPPDFLQKLTYLCWNHHPDVKQIDTVRAYTFGGFYFVEVDIVLQDEMPLRAAHDIGESLQNKLERLPQVERAFVHLDYEVSHRPEHAP